MADNYTKICILILEEHFGPTIRVIGYDLIKNGKRTLTSICSTSDLSLSEVIIYCITN